MRTQGYRSFVDPEHRLVDELFPGPPPRGTAGSAALLEAVLERARARIDYDPAPGRLPFDDLLGQVAGQARVRLNCINLCCALVSYLRRLGFSEHEVYVALAGRSNALQASLGVDFHAWVLAVRPDGVLWIDPATLEAERTTWEEVRAAHRIYVTFNDRDVRFLNAQKQRLPEPPAASSTMRLYLFGQATPQLRKVLDDPLFRSLAGRLMRRSELPFPEVADLAGERLGDLESWFDAALLEHRGDAVAAGSRLLPVPREAEAALASALGGLMDRYLGLAVATLPGLRAQVEATEAGRTWGWDRLAHAVVLGMALDLSVGRELDVESLAGGGATVWAIEAMSTRHAIGVGWSESADFHWALGQLWHQAVERPPIRVSAAMVAQLGAAALGQPVATDADSLYLRHFGLLRRRGPGLEPQIPVFLPTETVLLSARLSAWARRAVAEVLQPAFAAAARLPWWSTAGASVAHRAVIARLVLDYAAERVFDAGLVPAVGKEPAEDAWGRWLWLGELGDALPRSARGAAVEAPAEGRAG